MEGHKRNAEIIERHIGMEETPLSISNSIGIALTSIEAIISLYSQPATHEMIMQSKVNYGYRDWYIYENWQRLGIQTMAEVLPCSTVVIKRRAKLMSLNKKNRLVISKYKFGYRSRVILLNLETGIYYFSNNEAADTIGMNYNTFKNKMNAYRVNDTKFVQA